MAVTYEWDAEELEEAATEANGFDPDIADHHFCDTYAEAVEEAEYLASEGKPSRIVLVRHVGDNLEGETDRAWAYMERGKLPETFTYGADEDSGISVPKRFHAEVASAA
jgi:hypothetical protein